MYLMFCVKFMPMDRSLYIQMYKYSQVTQWKNRNKAFIFVFSCSVEVVTSPSSSSSETSDDSEQSPKSTKELDSDEAKEFRSPENLPATPLLDKVRYTVHALRENQYSISINLAKAGQAFKSKTIR